MAYLRNILGSINGYVYEYANISTQGTTSLVLEAGLCLCSTITFEQNRMIFVKISISKPSVLPEDDSVSYNQSINVNNCQHMEQKLFHWISVQEQSPPGAKPY